jgi:hypothetical protein
MNSVTILRNLWRRRMLVVVAGCVAFAAGWLFAFGPAHTFPPQPRGYTVGVATANLLVDTPRSQVIEVAPKGSDTLAARANVLANLMVDGGIKEAIAKRAGLPPKKIIASTPSPDDSQPPPKLTAHSMAYTTSVVLTSDMAELPIIRVQTQGPDVSKAVRLANAAVNGLSDYLNTKAADDSVDAARRLQVRPLGTAQGLESERGPASMMALVVVFIVFLGGCATILIVTALNSRWREAIEAETGTLEYQVVAEPLEDDEDELEPEDWPEPIELPVQVRTAP